MRFNLIVTRFGDVAVQDATSKTHTQVALFPRYGDAIRLLTAWFPGCQIKRVK